MLSEVHHDHDDAFAGLSLREEVEHALINSISCKHLNRPSLILRFAQLMLGFALTVVGS